MLCANLVLLFGILYHTISLESVDDPSLRTELKKKCKFVIFSETKGHCFSLKNNIPGRGQMALKPHNKETKFVKKLEDYNKTNFFD